VVKPNAVDAAQFPMEPVARANKVCKIVTVSRIHAKKGLTHLVECAQVLRERGVNAVLQVLGEPDSFDAESVAYYQELKGLIEASNLQDILRLEGRKSTPEVRRYLMDAAPEDLSCPSLLQLCQMGRDFEQLREVAKQQSDPLSYLAALIQGVRVRGEG